MKSDELRTKFINFFEKKGHKMIPSASLVPENDPSVLFTTAGMHPLVPYLMGESHPSGKRLVNVQKCIRTDDIDEVGDKVHHTFFEMLGNWSLGDYFKKEAIEWSFEFLTKDLNIPIDKFAVSVFAGDKDAPFDREAYDKWIDLGIVPERIAKLPKKNNWWGPAGKIGPCGPDTEMFIWTGSGPAPKNFQETNDDPNWVEIWNDVFMQYNKTTDGKFETLTQKNVDTGMGLERMLAVSNGLDDDYETELFKPIVEKIEELSNKKYQDSREEFRIIADHIKASTFAISDGVVPSNKGAGYVVRRMIRRAIVKGTQIGINNNFCYLLAEKVFEIYSDVYNFHETEIKEEIEKEEIKFRLTLRKGLSELQVMSKTWSGLVGNVEKQKATAKDVFNLYQSYGFPIELSFEEMENLDIKIDKEQVKQLKMMVENELRKHQELSRTASAGMFKGGLADAGETAVKYHTATHLLMEALRKVLDPNIVQRGSNITAERMRLDFNYPEKLTPDQLSKVEDLVNEQIEKDLPVTMEEMSLDEAKKMGAQGVFEHKYGDKVKVYSIGDPSADSGQVFSKEICGGPHVEKTGNLGHFKIKKEESSSAGVRRIKAILE